MKSMESGSSQIAVPRRSFILGAAGALMAMGKVFGSELTEKEKAAILEQEREATDVHNFQRLLNGESAEVIYGREKLLRSLLKRFLVVTCVDEREKAKLLSQMKELAKFMSREELEGIVCTEFSFAGSGVLMDSELFNKTADILEHLGIDLMKEYKLKSISEAIMVTRHQACGACALAAKEQMEKTGKPADADELGLKAADALRNRIGIKTPTKVVGFDNKADAKMVGDPSFHFANGMQINNDPWLNPDVLGLPSQFASEAVLGAKHVQREARICISIMLSEHGLGREALRKNKITFTVTGNDRKHATMDEVVDWLDPVLQEHSDIVRKPVMLVTPR